MLFFICDCYKMTWISLNILWLVHVLSLTVNCLTGFIVNWYCTKTWSPACHTVNWEILVSGYFGSYLSGGIYQTYQNMSDLTGKNQAGPTMFSAYRSESLVKICSLLQSGNNFLFVGPSNSVFKSRSFLQ